MQKFLIHLLTIQLVALSGASVAGTIYKCKNQHGILFYQNTECKQDTKTITAWQHQDKPNPPPIAEENYANVSQNPVLRLRQNASGHYAIDGSVDGKALNFVIDTGATYVSLPEDAAQEAGIYCDTAVTMKTANGNTDACTSKIKALKFGAYLLQDVTTVIVPNLEQPLLGMNVLQLFKIEQGKGEMQISIMQNTTTKATDNKTGNHPAASQ